MWALKKLKPKSGRRQRFSVVNEKYINIYLVGLHAILFKTKFTVFNQPRRALKSN